MNSAFCGDKQSSFGLWGHSKGERKGEGKDLHQQPVEEATTPLIIVLEAIICPPYAALATSVIIRG